MLFDRRAPIFAAAALAVAAAMAAPAIAQDLHPSRRPSPMGMTRVTLGDTYVRVIYSRPYKRGRDNIFGTEESGALVPWGKPWRTGANEATEITVTGDVRIAGKVLPAGTYSLYTIPGAEGWTVHFNAALGLTGTMRRNPETDAIEPAYSSDRDVLVVEAAPTQLEEEVDQLTFAFENEGETSADLVLRWIRTEVRLPVSLPG